MILLRQSNEGKLLIMEMTFKKFIGSKCFGVYRGGRAFGTLTLSDSNLMIWQLVVLSPQAYAGRYTIEDSYDGITSYIKKRFGGSTKR